MAEERVQRRLVAILAADFVGYSRLMEQDEVGTLAALKGHFGELIEPKVDEHGGRIVKTTGDGLLAEFPSVIEAVQSAIDIQRGMTERNAGVLESSRLRLRMGINLGDVIIQGSDIFGDGVNIAARLEAMAEPGGILMAGTAYDHVKNRIKCGVDDLGVQPLRNLAEPIRLYRVVTEGDNREPVLERAPTALPLVTSTSIAVLPFVNLSGDTEQGYFADGITNDLITELCRFHELSVTASSSVFVYKGKSVGVQQISRELGVRYVLEGSVQRMGPAIRLNAQLVDVTNGAHLWAERYKRSAENLFDIQDELVQAIVAALAIKVDVAERERAKRKPPSNLSAYDYYLRGRDALVTNTKEANVRARKLFEKAIEIDPRYARAWSSLASALVDHWRFGWSEDSERALAIAADAAAKCVALDPHDYNNHWTMGFVLVFSQRHDEGIAEYEKALALNPNDPDFLADMAGSLVYAGRRLEAIAQVERAMRINPLHQEWYMFTLGWAYYMDRQFERALSIIRRINNPPAYTVRLEAATLAQLGRLDEAKAKAEEFRKLEPTWTLSLGARWPYKYPEDRELKLGGLRKAGLPE